MNFSQPRIEVIAEVFTNLAAGFFGSILVFPGIFGLRRPSDLLALLILNVPSGILCLLIAFKLKEYLHGKS